MGVIFLLVNKYAPWSTCVQRLSVSKLITRDVTFDIRGEGSGFFSARDDIFHLTFYQQRLEKARKFMGINELCLHDVKL